MTGYLIAALAALSIIAPLGWYAEHERVQVVSITAQRDQAKLAAEQAEADAKSAIAAAQAAQKQAAADRAALQLANSDHVHNAQASQAAQIVIEHDATPAMQQQVPANVWNAISGAQK